MYIYIYIDICVYIYIYIDDTFFSDVLLILIKPFKNNYCLTHTYKLFSICILVSTLPI